jgi:hypothetical protein
VLFVNHSPPLTLVLIDAVIPLSKKIRDCGVFGPTSDENLNYATNNRNTWVKEGEAIVADMLTRVEREYEEGILPPEVEVWDDTP